MKINVITIISSVVALICFNSCSPDAKENEKMETKESIVLSNIQSRKSVRKYSDKAVEPEKVEQLLRAAMAAPTGKNTQPWRFVVVDDRAKLDAMAESLPYAKMLKFAPMAIIVCGDEEISNYWYLDCSAATQNLLLAAEALDLGAVWTTTYPYEDRMAVVKKHINHPDNIKSLCVIPIGYPEGKTKSKEKWDATKVFQNEWKH